MNSNRLFNIFRSKAEQSKRSQKSFPIMVICFLIASFMWALIMLSKNYSAHVRFALQYEHLPEGKMITNQLPKRIEFLINASGYDLLSYRLKSKKNEISINVEENVEYRNKISENVYRVATRNLLSEFTEQLKRDVNIQSVYPDSIEFNFTSLLTKKVPLRSNVKIEFEKQFDATGAVRLVPDSIVVSGPLSYLDTLSFVETVDTTFSGIKSLFNKVVPLKFPENLTSNTRSARIMFPVEKFTEGTVQVPLQTINNKENQKLKIFPEKVTVNYLVALSNYERVSESQFNVVADASAIGTGSNKLNVQLTKNPEFVKVTIIEPQKVEYIILK